MSIHFAFALGFALVVNSEEAKPLAQSDAERPVVVEAGDAAAKDADTQPVEVDATSDEPAAEDTVEPVFSTLKGFRTPDNQQGRLIEIPIDGTIELGVASFVERMVAQVDANDVVLIRIKTFGGRVDGAVRIRDALLSSPAPVVVFIDSRAISAGALISLAGDTIIMGRGASIGAATPVQGGGPNQAPQATSEKVVSYMRAEMRATAEANGRRGDIAEAMVDATIEIEGISEKDKLLTLTSSEAFKHGISNATVDHYEAAVADMGLNGLARVSGTEGWGEKLARILTDPAVSSLLMTFGFLGLALELYTPGFGVSGAIGISCLMAFFFGQYAANLAGPMEFILFMSGLALIAAEIFIIPGFGIAGISGALFILWVVGKGFLDFDIPWEVASDLGYVREGVESLSVRIIILLVVFALATWMVAKRLSTTRDYGMVAHPPEPESPARSGHTETHENREGRAAIALTDLRPSGFIDMDGLRVDALSEGDMVRKGQTVEILRDLGTEVVVRLKVED